MGMLIITKGQNKNAAYKLGHRVLTIGRGTANLIQILDPGVSRRHASIWWDGQSYMIRDLESSNGVFVNNNKVNEARLHIGDTIRIGNVVFKLAEDMANVEDQVLKARNADRTVVSRTTMMINYDPNSPPTGNSSVVDIDKAARSRDAALLRDTNRFSAMALRESDRQIDLMTETLNYALRTVDADRCMAFMLTGPRSLKLVAAVFSREVPSNQHKIQPVKHVLTQALKTLAPVRGRSEGAIFAAAAVPLKVGKRTIGILYADCMALNPRIFIDQDIDILNLVAPAVVSAIQGKT